MESEAERMQLINEAIEADKAHAKKLQEMVDELSKQDIDPGRKKEIWDYFLERAKLIADGIEQDYGNSPEEHKVVEDNYNKIVEIFPENSEILHNATWGLRGN